MNKILDNFFIKDEIIYNNIIKLLLFLNNIFNEYNNKIVKRIRKIDFYDLFFYMLYYNSSIVESHVSTNYHFNINNNKNISENAFINRLVKLDSDIIKEINYKFIDFYYSLFNIDVNNIITATDGSNIKLVSSLDKHFKLNKNKYYTNATISCIYDVNNNLPLSMNINKSFNEVDILLNQLKDDIFKKYKIINVSDRGYDNIKLIKHYLINNINFVSRITKNNTFIKKINNNDKTTFTFDFDDKSYKLQIIKYTNLEKPKIKENKNELMTMINEINKKINLIQNCLIVLNTEYDKLRDKNKLNNK